VIKAAKQGLTATLRGAAATARQAGRTLARQGSRIGRAAARTVRRPGVAARLVGRAVARRGRLVMRGLRGGFARGARSLDDLARRLWNAVRFRRFKLVRRGRRIQLWAEINPWVLLADGSIVDVLEHEIPAGTRIGQAVQVPAGPGRSRPGILLSAGEELGQAEAQALIRHAQSTTIGPGPNFLSHFQDHRHLLGGVVGRRFPGNPAGHADFLAELNRLTRSGELRPAGLTSIRRGDELVYAFEGSFRRTLRDGQVRTEALTMLMRPDGEWVTLLRSGEGLANTIQRNFRTRF
jgi:hypothetical protein